MFTMIGNVKRKAALSILALGLGACAADPSTEPDRGSTQAKAGTSQEETVSGPRAALALLRLANDTEVGFYDTEEGIAVLTTSSLGVRSPITSELQNLAPHELYEALSGSPAPVALRERSLAQEANASAPASGGVAAPTSSVASSDSEQDLVAVSSQALFDDTWWIQFNQDCYNASHGDHNDKGNVKQAQVGDRTIKYDNMATGSTGGASTLGVTGDHDAKFGFRWVGSYNYYTVHVGEGKQASFSYPRRNIRQDFRVEIHNASNSVWDACLWVFQPN